MNHPGVRRLSPDAAHFAVLHSRDARSLHADVKGLINALGSASSAAQRLPRVITTAASFASSDCTLYLLLDDEDRRAVGLTKVGPRHLFLWDRRGAQHEMTALCLLDFFTVPECQRRGYGRRMIDRMLQDKGLEMRQVPIDRPSGMCLAFMKSQFGLAQFLAQSNAFVVFDEFWEDDARPKALLAGNRARPRIVTPAAPGKRREKRQVNPITWAPMA
jgi:alpha-tubulin N-acetyltransferase 1